MKEESEIQRVLDNLDPHIAKYPNMTYENGIEEMGMWILGEISDDEFEYAK